MDEVVVLGEGHLIDERLVAHILVADVGGGYALALVGEDLNSHAAMTFRTNYSFMAHD